MQPPLSVWLKRRPKGKAPRKRLPRVSTKRQREAATYRLLRAAFLQANPCCQAWKRIIDHLWKNDVPWMVEHAPSPAPHSTEIHHTKKPRCKYLNDISTWLAVSRWSHEWIEQHKNTARALGLLQ